MAWLLAQAIAQPSPTCSGADIAVQNVRRLRSRGKDSDADRVVIEADLVNVGGTAQDAKVAQRVELLKDGRVVAVEHVRPLRSGERYPVALRFFSPSDERGSVLHVIVRYVPEDGRAENCNLGNNSVEKTF